MPTPPRPAAPIAPVTAAPTPGPWRVEANRHIVSIDGIVIATAAIAHLDPDEPDANAALLAAAPALRDALAALLVEYTIAIDGLPDATADAARALLASLPGGTDGR